MTVVGDEAADGALGTRLHDVARGEVEDGKPAAD